ncbi:hypothetical protein SAMN04487770_13651 [Butyrivibrio sp. ob235]|uniref:hypothetical protein n=1 Tax=Butyrivibrio sp. ob235 TaxID=1761780 RepID=UPI0008C4DE7E|nr:hypothetical protein [Butyrivibrio sp. ob235]SEM39460.1 hypothetical protein SAMN04487770_13651 [Butyrivibrio sp. ob235]
MRVEKEIVLQNARDFLEKINDYSKDEAVSDLIREEDSLKKLIQQFIEGLEKNDYDSAEARWIADAFQYVCSARVKHLEEVSATVSDKNLSMLYDLLTVIIMQTDIAAYKDDTLYDLLSKLSDEEVDEYKWEHSAYRILKPDYLWDSSYNCSKQGARMLEDILGEMPEFDDFLRKNET